MILFKQAEKISDYLVQQKKFGKKIGFVPTMGALHDGHLSLIKASKEINDLTVCSIFINPTQFNNQEDFRNYPVTIDTDIEKLLTSGCDILFLPSQEQIYSSGYMARHYELGELETVLEGFYRPGHFQGVCQVVDRLLDVTQPDNLYLGAKDYQQCKVIARLLELTGKGNQIKLNIEPTLRENDGLAMSSRNLRLSPEQRQAATAIYEALLYIKKNSTDQSITEAQNEAAAMLVSRGFKPDYVQIADADTLLPANGTTKRKIALIAAFIGDIRLIDNLLLN
ncbi:MAG TPA: pantoate--beta-alanine ligase [Flavisolibacter sp.]